MRPFDPEPQCPPETEDTRGHEYTMLRLDCLIDWYARHARNENMWHKVLAGGAMVAAAAVTVLAAADAPSWWLALGGGTVVVAQGLNELFQFQTNWVRDAQAKELLKREKALYFAQAGPYRANGGTDDLARRFAEQIEAIAGKELAGWVQSQSAAAKANHVDDGSPAPK
jgi:hypothetical protein